MGKKELKVMEIKDFLEKYLPDYARRRRETEKRVEWSAPENRERLVNTRLMSEYFDEALENFKDQTIVNFVKRMMSDES
jgi:hypothetical protein